MDNKNLNKLDDSILDKVSGGTEAGFDAGGGLAEEKMPFCCTKCNTVFDITPGQKRIKCPNPSCGEVFVIEG